VRYDYTETRVETLICGELRTAKEQHGENFNSLQLCHFLNLIQGDLHLVGLALKMADNPKIYCSDNGFAIGAPKLIGIEETYYWHRNLSKEMKMEEEEQ
jgi:hypothetical protein